MRACLAIVSRQVQMARQRKAMINWIDSQPPIEDYLELHQEDWRKVFAPRISGLVTDAAGYWGAVTGVAFDVRNLEAEAWFEDYMFKFSDPITKGSRKELRQLFELAARDGWSIPQMQTALEGAFTKWIGGNSPTAAFFAEARLTPDRTEMIARTETTRAFAYGSRQLYKQAGLEHKEWLATSDSRTRPSHHDADGQVTKIDEPFLVGGYPMMQPGDSSLGAPVDEIVNCRCTVLPVLVDPNTLAEPVVQPPVEPVEVVPPKPKPKPKPKPAPVPTSELNRFGQTFSKDIPTRAEWDAMFKRTGLDSHVMSTDLRSWSGSGYDSIRMAQINDLRRSQGQKVDVDQYRLDQAYRIEHALQQMPVYQGPVYRRFYLPQGLPSFRGGTAAPGELFSNNALTSFTHTYKSSYLQPEQTQYSYLRSANNLSATSMEAMSSFSTEYELMAPATATYRINKIIPRSELSADDPLYVAAGRGREIGYVFEIEEIDP